MMINEREVSYGSVDDSHLLSIIELVRKGIRYLQFSKIVKASPFSMAEWSQFLHLSERTLHRYETDNTSFDPIQSEKIVQLSMLNNYGISVFGSSQKYHAWLGAHSIALGGIIPKALLDNHFGIEMVKDEIGRIEHGVLA